jgi:hypothetical protein
MSKKTKALRFAVGSFEDTRSSVWRLWAKGDDLYLSARAFGGISKFSFHKSGKHRYAINAEIERENAASDRVLYKWERASEFMPGWTESMGIVIPPRITQKPFKNPQSPNKVVHFADTPSPATKVVFKIVFSSKEAILDDLKRVVPYEITLHGKLSLERELVWLISFQEVFSQAEREQLEDDFSKLKIHLKAGATSKNINHAFMHILMRTLVPFVIDLELGEENLSIEDAES